MTNPVVVLREEFDDWAILFNPDSAAAVGINPVGVYIWKQMDGKNTIDHIAAIAKEQFEEVPETHIEEVKAFIEELDKYGFLAYEEKP